MGRRRSLIATLNQIAREQAREARYQHKLARLAHIADQEQLAAAQNQAVQDQLGALSSILNFSLTRDVDVDLTLLRREANESDLDNYISLVTPSEPKWKKFKPWTLGILAQFFAWARRRDERRLSEARRLFDAAIAERNRVVQRRAEAFAGLQREAADHNADLDSLQRSLDTGDFAAMARYAELVLLRSPYGEDFPLQLRIAAVPETKQLVIEYELPKLDAVIPASDSFRYVKAQDVITQKPRPEKIRNAEYLSVVSQIALRTIHEVFASRRMPGVECVTFTGVVDTINKSTGQRLRPSLISLRVTRSDFSNLVLDSVDPVRCARHLNARVTPSATELVAVTPIVSFNMVNPRFVAEMDVLSQLDARPNLMDLSPSEFESLVTNLFQKMGLETRLTRPLRDGGVDCVAWDTRPALGGKVVIQAKRYKNTVGVSAVRDLYGTMQNENASKGILVTTSGYGPSSVQFAAGKPIDLLSGGELLALLKQHAGVDARIVMPDEWAEAAGAQIE